MEKPLGRHKIHAGMEFKLEPLLPEQSFESPLSGRGPGQWIWTSALLQGWLKSSFWSADLGWGLRVASDLLPGAAVVSHWPTFEKH